MSICEKMFQTIILKLNVEVTNILCAAAAFRQLEHLLLHVFPVRFLKAEFVTVTVALDCLGIIFE